MANEPVKRQTAALALTSGFLWGWLALALIMPLGSLALNPVLLALIAATVVLILRVAYRPDAPYVGIGVLIGLLVTALVTVLSAVGLAGEGTKLLLAGIVILLSYHV